MTPQESREGFIDGILHEKELKVVKELGLYEEYVEGRVSITTVLRQLKDQAP
jgi:hypothetical protein